MMYFVIFLLSFSVKNVFLHMEKFNKKLNLLHTGLSFSDEYKRVRYDFRLRPFYSGSYETKIDLDSCDSQVKKLETKIIKWGETNKTWKEISDFEIEVLCTKRYILGVYDCRHYVRDFTLWCCDNRTPVWDLYVLWKCPEYESNLF